MSFLLGPIGTAVPTHTINQAEALELADAVLRPDAEHARLLRPLYRRAGVANRHICVPYQTALTWAAHPPVPKSCGEPVEGGAATQVRMQLYEEHAAPLALEAAQMALERSDVSPSSITHLVTVSCTGFSAPGVDTALIRGLDLPATTQRVHVGFMGCHGAVNGLRVAEGLTAASPDNRVLLCAVELCSLHYFFDWAPDKLVSNALFADGAAALVGQAGVSSNGHACIEKTGSFLFADTTDAMTWRLSNHGFEMTLSSRVPDAIATNLRPWLSEWLAEAGLAIDDVEHWAVHPGGPRILSAVGEALELPGDALATSRDILSNYGNMSSPTVLFILNQMREQHARGPCVVLGFGPGLVAEAALARL